MAHTCRGTINLNNAIIQSEDSFHFVVTNGGQQTFHLKASNELEKQKWVSALEIAKNKSKQYCYQNNVANSNGGFNSNQTDNSDDEDNNSIEAEKNELANMLRVLQQKLDDLCTSHEFVLKHSGALTRSLTEIESIQTKPDEITIKTINERSTVYKITMLAVVNACQEFINLAQLQTRKMHKVLQSERDMRAK
jgi:oxysterol-binding protein 1